MRKSREEAAETRKRIVRAAACKFREKGIGATGLGDLMKAAGLTHGGFYKHFASKPSVRIAAISPTDIAHRWRRNQTSSRYVVEVRAAMGKTTSSQDSGLSVVARGGS